MGKGEDKGRKDKCDVRKAEKGREKRSIKGVREGQ